MTGPAITYKPAITFNLHWTHAPRFVALALVAFIAGVTFGVAGF